MRRALHWAGSFDRLRMVTVRPCPSTSSLRSELRVEDRTVSEVEPLTVPELIEESKDPIMCGAECPALRRTQQRRESCRRPVWVACDLI